MDEMNNMNEVTTEETSVGALVPENNVEHEANNEETGNVLVGNAIIALAVVGGVTLAVKGSKAGVKLVKKVFPNAHMPAFLKGKGKKDAEETEKVEVEATEVENTEED